MVRRTFDEVVLFARTGLNPRTNFKLGNGDNKYITIKNIHNNEIIIDDNTDVIDDRAIELIHRRSQIKKGDILFCSIGRLGDMYIIEDEPKGWDINESVFAFTVDTSLVRQKYFYYVFKNRDTIEYLSKNSSGSTFKSIKMNQLKKMTFDLPSLDKQDCVVAILDSLSSIIAKREEELERLDELIKARFVELFGDPNINSKGWDECPLSEKLDVVGGYAFKSDQFDEEYGVPVLRIGNINAGYFRPVNLVFWKEDDALERYVMYPGDLVMSLTGTVGKDDYGNVCILGNEYEKYYLNQRNAKLEIKDGIDKFYLSELLKFEQIKKRLTGISRGVRQANISNKDILNLVVPIPPMEIQNQFAEFVQQVDKSKVAKNKLTNHALLR
ncbi:type I restriction enzyme, S subunit [Lachnospiraceae bacterium XBB1006]|nr:type I restriction enzyme, S subunit [Lachnospiraceae bacterium XBB1006]